VFQQKKPWRSYMSSLPTGTVTFLFTDIEGSTQLSQRYPDAFPTALARHHAILNQAMTPHQGQVFQIIGDAFCVAFHTASGALNAALEAQRGLLQEAWNLTQIRVRMGIHTGEASLGDMDARAGGYTGYLTLTRAQRVMSTAHGGQVLLSSASAELVRGQLPDRVGLRDMGEHHLKGIVNPEHLWQVVAPDLPQDFPPLQSLNTIPNNLPIQVTSFVGREREVTEGKRLLATTRLLTLTGSGGMGKTRLSLQVATDLLDTFKDGAWFIELAPLTDPALVPITVASVLGVREEQDRPLMATLMDWLRNKQLLFILDNCEHLIEACAKFAHAVLHVSRETRILASSREALGITGESTYRIPSLETPNPEQVDQIPVEALTQYAAVRLFVERATQALATFSLTPANASAVVQICSRLDGIPLAIELAAARVRSLRVEQIAARLDDRFRLLTSGDRTAEPRQQTLRSLIDWSYSLLTEPERVLLQRLSVFAGGWTLEASEAVCSSELSIASSSTLAGDGDEPDLTTDDWQLPTANVLDLLTRLVDKSLVVFDEQAIEPRYRMLETIRDYARETLQEANESERMRDQHLRYFVRLAEHSEPFLQSTQRAEWLPRLEAEHDNLRLALEWACERELEVARWLAGVLYWFWHYGDHLSEPRAWYARVLDAGERVTATRGLALALMGSGLVSTRQYYSDEAQSPLEQSVNLWQQLGEPQRLAWSLWALARLLVYRGESARACAIYAEHESLFRASGNRLLLVGALSYWGRALTDVRRDDPAAKARLDEALALGRTLQDPHGLYVCYMNLGHWALAQGDYATARRHYLESLAWRRQLGTRWLIALGLREVAHVMCLQDDYRQAEPVYAEALALARALGDQRSEASIAQALGDVALHLGDLVRATTLLTDSLSCFRNWADSLGIAIGLRGFADLQQVKDEPEEAARLLGFVEAWLQSNQFNLVLFERAKYERSVAAARAQLSASDFIAAWEAGRKLTLEQAVALALQTDA
jgi:predicted ATPase/class 3 adenylate cyclase